MIKIYMFGVLACFMLFNAGCKQPVAEVPALDTVQWASHENTGAGYSFAYPNIFETETQGDEIVIRTKDDKTAFRVVFVTEAESDKRGLWANHEPVQNIQMAGKRGQKYVYDHSDAIFYVHTVSYVIPHRGKYLGLEFRTNQDKLNPTQQYILNAFTVN